MIPAVDRASASVDTFPRSTEWQLGFRAASRPPLVQALRTPRQNRGCTRGTKAQRRRRRDLFRACVARRSHDACPSSSRCAGRFHPCHLEFAFQAGGRRRRCVRVRVQLRCLRRVFAVGRLGCRAQRTGVELACGRLPAAQRRHPPRLQPVPAARLSGRGFVGGLSDRAWNRPDAVVDRRVHGAAGDSAGPRVRRAYAGVSRPAR